MYISKYIHSVLTVYNILMLFFLNYFVNTGNSSMTLLVNVFPLGLTCTNNSVSAEPTFSIEPSNITVNPVSGTSRAAFACSVYAYKTLQNIEWYYEMVQFGSGMGIGPGPMNGLQTGNESGGISIFSGSSGVDVSKTSILVLDNVGSQHEGLYRCVATFQDGQVITSRNATLMYNSKSLYFHCNLYT